MTLSTFPTQTLIQNYYETGMHVRNENPFLADPEFYNPACDTIYRDLSKYRLGDTINLNVADYYQAQRVNGFAGANLNSLIMQPTAVKTQSVTLGAFKAMAQPQIATNDTGWQYQQDNAGYFSSIMKNIHRGSASSFGNQLYQHTTEAFRTSNQMYSAFLDLTNFIALPFCQDIDTMIAANPKNSTTEFNAYYLNSKVMGLRQVLGENMTENEINFAAAFNQEYFSNITANQGSVFTPDFTQTLWNEISNPARDMFQTLQGTTYSLAKSHVMTNNFAYRNSNWILGSIGVPSTGVPTTNQVPTLTAFSLENDGGNATGTLTFAPGLAGGLLAVGDVFFFKPTVNGRNFIRANDEPNGGSTAVSPLCLVLGKTNNYDPTDKSTWFYPGNAGGTAFNVNFVGYFRPSISVLGDIKPFRNSPNIDLVLDFPTLPTPAQVSTALAANFIAPAGAAAANRLIPLLGYREHVCLFRTNTHYEFSTMADFVQIKSFVESAGPRREIDTNFLEFCDFLYDQKAMMDVPLALGYQGYWTNTNNVPDSSLINLYMAHTSFFENYNLNAAAVAMSYLKQ